MKTVIEMAREAGFTEGELAFMGDNFIRFAELVRADEREACAKVCEEYETNNDITATWLNIVAEAIRARSKNDL
jgi:hypothetical protein